MKLLLELLFIAPQLIAIIESVSWGKFIRIEDAPYLVSLIESKRYYENDYMCGGSIISEYWIVSAAHCFGAYPRIPNYIVTGESKRREEKSLATYEIDKVYLHGDYDDKAFVITNDIVLIKLKKPITFDERRQPIKIRRIPPNDNDTVVIMGFGDQGAARGYAEVLRQSEAKVTTECDDLINYPILEKLAFCASNGTTDVCPGDSGGPAVINGQLAGIVSYGPACAFHEFQDYEPGVYTRVDAFYNWIVNITGIEFL